MQGPRFDQNQKMQHVAIFGFPKIAQFFFALVCRAGAIFGTDVGKERTLEIWTNIQYTVSETYATVSKAFSV